MTNEIQIYNIRTVLTKELLSSEQAIARFLADIDNLKTLTFDFSTQEGIKQAKELKTQANKTVKLLKEFCEPLEAEGKRIADARSKISTKLATGKDNVIDEILKPINDAEDKLKELKSKLAMPITDLHSASIRLEECKHLLNFNWLVLKDDAVALINQLQGLALIAKQDLEEKERLAKEAADKERLEREEKIRKEAEEKANAQAELRIKQEAERLEREKQEAIKVEQDKAELEIEAKKQIELKEKAEAERLAKNKEHQAKIHNEILEDLVYNISFGVNEDSNEKLTTDQARIIIKAIAKNKVRNLAIKY